MRQQEKQLLFSDLCARLPYGVFIHYHWSREGNIIDEDRELDFSDVETLKYNIENPQNDWCEISWKPYLRPMSSMTKEEKKEYESFFSIGEFSCGGSLYGKEYEYIADSPDDISQSICLFDWLLEHHFDFRGLIPMGLALETPEGDV